MDNKNETSTLALGQKVGANENTWMMPTGMSTAEKTRLKASNGESSRTRPVALRTKTVVEPCGFEPLAVDMLPSSSERTNSKCFVCFHLAPTAPNENKQNTFDEKRFTLAAARCRSGQG